MQNLKRCQKGKKRRKDKKGAITLYIAFFIVAILVIVIAAIFAPMGVLFNSEMYKAGEDILAEANASIQNISDPTVKAQVQASINSAQASAQDNIEINANIFQYSWIFILVLAAVMVFLATRTITEYQTGGFV